MRSTVAAPSCSLAFASERLAGTELLAGIADGAGDAPIVGRSSPTQIGPTGSARIKSWRWPLAAVALEAMTADAAGHDGTREAGREIERNWPARPQTVIRRARRCCSQRRSPADQNELVRGAYSMLGGGDPAVGVRIPTFRRSA